MLATGRLATLHVLSGESRINCGVTCTMLNRRSLLGELAGLPVKVASAHSQTAFGTTPPLPQTGIFEAGDLLWPKKPGSFVPYNQRVGTGPEQDRQFWEQEKEDFLKRAANGETSLTAEQIDNIRRLDYREFVARYHGNQKPDEPGVYSSGGGLYVGHVALIDFDDSHRPVGRNRGPMGPRCRSQHLQDVASRKARRGDIAGRLRDHPNLIVQRSAQRRRSSSVTPTIFWNFDLNDDSGFYCSKLVWLAIFRRLRFAVDGDMNSKRGFWFSPKQLLYLRPFKEFIIPAPM